MARYFTEEVNKTRIVVVFFIIFSAVAAYAMVQLSKTIRPMTLEEYEQYGAHKPTTPFDAFTPFSIQ